MRNPFRRTGQAMQTLRQLKKSDALKGAKYNIASHGRKDLTKVVIGIGQIHPVARGKFSYFTARKIGLCQSWIYQACLFFHNRYRVTSFGEEGYAADGNELLTARLHANVLRHLKEHVSTIDTVRKFLLLTAQQWRKAIKSGDKKEISKRLTQLNGLALLQAADNDVNVFPIEQRLVHGRISVAIGELQNEIATIEQSSLYKKVLSKQGKKLTKEEYEIAKKRNALVANFNTMLQHPDREKSILREVLDFSAHQKITVFVLGQAHMKPMLSLAKKHANKDTLFVWITPPQLWLVHTYLFRTLLITCTFLIICGIYINRNLIFG